LKRLHITGSSKTRKKERTRFRRDSGSSSGSDSPCELAEERLERIRVRGTSYTSLETWRSSEQVDTSSESVSSSTREIDRLGFRRGSDSSIGSSDGPSEPPRNRVGHISTQTTEKVIKEVGSSSNQIGVAVPSQETEERSEEEGTSCLQPSASSTAACPSTSSEAGLPATSVASSDGDLAKCPICLGPFSAEEVATPDTCNHFFCVGCLKEWSYTVNTRTCPLDREEYNVILVRRYPDGEEIRRIPLPPRTRPNDIHDILLPVCELCSRSDLENAFFYSFGCDHIYHLECLSSFMGSTPFDEWFCSICAPAVSHGSVWTRTT
jgi:hypothetical protein